MDGNGRCRCDGGLSLGFSDKIRATVPMRSVVTFRTGDSLDLVVVQPQWSEGLNKWAACGTLGAPIEELCCSP